LRLCARPKALTSTKREKSDPAELIDDMEEQERESCWLARRKAPRQGHAIIVFPLVHFPLLSCAPIHLLIHLLVFSPGPKLIAAIPCLVFLFLNFCLFFSLCCMPPFRCIEPSRALTSLRPPQVIRIATHLLTPSHSIFSMCLAS
jgi:hypothetical protein